MKRFILQCTIGLALSLGLSASAWADFTLTLNPDADSFVSAANPDSNYGGAGALEISAKGLPNGEFQSVLRFDLASVKFGFDAEFGAGNWGVSAVTLRLSEASPAPLPTFFNPSAAGQIAVTWMKNSTWTEGTGSPKNGSVPGITFNSLAAIFSASDQPMGSFKFDGMTAGVNTYTLTSASGFVSDVQLGNKTGLLLTAADSVVSALFTSNNNPTSPTGRPLLSVTAVSTVPEPSSFAIVSVATIAGFWVRRRRCRLEIKN